MSEGPGKYFNKAPVPERQTQQESSEGERTNQALGEFAAAFGLDQERVIKHFASLSSRKGPMEAVADLFSEAAHVQHYGPADAGKYQKLVVGALGPGYTALLPTPGQTFDPNIHEDTSTATKQWDPNTQAAFVPKIFSVILPGISGPEGSTVKSLISTSSSSYSFLAQERSNRRKAA
ncbi:MAG: hypothetical protein AB199_01235 [Parcubacteria bacterium C7867-004]|nr:MAG: hypothetical protein AB199_01235 [Parcubacteria bacterium C7867-004]